MNVYDLTIEVQNDRIKFINDLTDLCNAYLRETKLDYKTVMSCLGSKFFDLQTDMRVEELVNSLAKSLTEVRNK